MQKAINKTKSWPNGLASRRKFWTCVQLAFPLATHLRRLALTLVELKFVLKSTQVLHRLAAQRTSTQVHRKSSVYKRQQLLRLA